MSFRAFPEALSAFAEQTTCTLSRNQEGGARRARGSTAGGLLKGGGTED